MVSDKPTVYSIVCELIDRTDRPIVCMAGASVGDGNPRTMRPISTRTATNRHQRDCLSRFLIVTSFLLSKIQHLSYVKGDCMGSAG